MRSHLCVKGMPLSEEDIEVANGHIKAALHH